MPVFQTDSFQGDALGGDIAAVTGAGLCDTLGGLNFGGMLFWATTGLGIYTSLWNDSRELPAVPSWVLQASGAPATLDIDFVHNLAFNSPSATTIQALLTCTRASTGYYTSAEGVLSSFGNNVLRYGDNGLLVEESRTNSNLQSQAFSTAGWNKTNILSATDNATAAPDGTTTAASIIPDTTALSIHRVYNSNVSATAVSYSVYAKANGYSQILFRENSTSGSSVGFTLSGVGSATAGSGLGGGTFSNIAIKSLPNGWYLCQATLTFASATTQSMSINIADGGYTSGDANSYVWTPNGTSGVFLWGGQLEAGAFPTSYIPTTSSSATRAADNVSFTSAAFVVTPGTFYTQAFSPVTSEYLLSGASNTELLSSGTASQAIANNGTNSLTATAGSGTWAAASKAALAYQASARALCMNNGTVASDAHAAGTLTSIYIGSNAGAASFWNGNINRVAFWSIALSSAQLGTLTT